MAADPRFARLTTDPRFRRPKQKQLKVELDDRFKHVLQGEDFGATSKGEKGKKKTDKYGRPLKSSHHSDQLKSFYRVRSPSPSAPDKAGEDFIDYARGEGALESSGSEGEEDEAEAETSEEEGEVEIGGKVRRKIPGQDVSEDEEDEEEEGGLRINLSEDEDVETPIDVTGKGKGKGKSRAVPQHESLFPLEEEEAEEEETIDPTTRIAIVNMDWDNLRSLDIYKVFQSILSSSYNPIEMESSKKGEGSKPRVRGQPTQKPDGRLIDVKIYPSEFGKERMAREEIEGPAADLFVGGSGNGSRSNKKGGPNGKARRKPVRLAGEDSDDEDNLSVEGYEGFGKTRFIGSEDEEDDVDDDGEEEDEFEDDEDEDMETGDDEEKGVEEEDEEDEDETNDPLGLDMGQEEELSDMEEDVDMDKLRNYQLERLRYYYAVATFSTPSAAQYIFKECNGTEFERTANVFDMSYVPEGMEFEEDDVKEETREDVKGYKGNEFVTDALRHSKVKLTWDQDDPNRVKMLRRPLTKAEMDEDDFKAYLASSSDEDEDDEELLPSGAKEADFEAAEAKRVSRKKAKEKTEKLRQLLLSGDNEADVWGKHSTLPDMQDNDDKPSGDMEITFKAGLTSATQAVDDENLTTLEKYQRRMKEKKERKKEKKELKAGSRAIAKGEEVPEADEKDDFFGGEDEEEDLPPAKPVKAAPAKNPTAPVAKLPETVEIASDAKHFSMQDIVKAEKTAGKRKRTRKGKKDEREKDVELGDSGFDINVKDDRFKAIFEEPAFAIDPSNPHFLKTKAMGKLLTEGSKRRQEASVVNSKRPIIAVKKQPATMAANVEPAQKSVNDLVASVKRKMGADENGESQGGKEGEHKKRKRHRKSKATGQTEA